MGLLAFEFQTAKRVYVDVLADGIRPELCDILCSSETRGRREYRVHAAPAVSCANSAKENAHEHTGSAEAVRHPLRNGFTAYAVLSPATNSCLSPSSAD